MTKTAALQRSLLFICCVLLSSHPFMVKSDLFSDSNGTKSFWTIPQTQNNKIESKIPRSIEESPPFLLVAQSQFNFRSTYISRVNLADYELEEMPVSGLKFVLAIDFDMKNNCLYWADHDRDTPSSYYSIGRHCFKNGSMEMEILVKTDLGLIGGIALDWVSNVLYFVDKYALKIQLIRTDINTQDRMRRTILGPKHLWNPQSIAVHPKAGYIFWGDWNHGVYRPASVNRANLDGTNARQLIGSAAIPRGITIDYITERIYWVDKNSIYYTDFDGNGFKHVIRDPAYVSSPAGIGVFKDNMYWANSAMEKIFVADKDYGAGITSPIDQLHQVYEVVDLKVYDQSAQTGSNQCKSNPCPYICLGAPNDTYVCLCPDGMLANATGHCVCPSGLEPFANSTCPRVEASCSYTNFLCDNGNCISLRKVCNGANDCGDESDEADCIRFTCDPDKFGCDTERFLLVAERDRISRVNLVDYKLHEITVPGMKNVVTIEFDMKNNCLYWAGFGKLTTPVGHFIHKVTTPVGHFIGRQCFKNEISILRFETEILIDTDLGWIEGMALDWVSNVLYFVDGTHTKIQIIRTDINTQDRKRKTIIGSDKLYSPRGIAVHPKAGYMFWTDRILGSDLYSVNKANLDGTNIRRLYHVDQQPKRITIDYIAERIYWVYGENSIGMTDFDGNGFKRFRSDPRFPVFRPIAVAVFNDKMYVGDQRGFVDKIFVADKNDGSGVTSIINDLDKLRDLKVFGHGVQTGSNQCESNPCPYICLGAPNDTYVCLCPDGMVANATGHCVCPSGLEPFANFTCPRLATTCSPNQFLCGNGICISDSLKCDDDNDCGDESDEDDCCGPDEFGCDRNVWRKCIPKNKRCDHHDDCDDGTDESNCPNSTRSNAQFECNFVHFVMVFCSLFLFTLFIN